MTYADLETRARGAAASALEPEEESPILFLRLRKAAAKHGLQVFHLGQWTTPAVLRRPLGAAPARPSPATADPRRAGRRGGRAADAGDRRRASGAAPPGASCWSASAPPRCPACSPPSAELADAHRRPPRPGCRGGPASAARSTPARCPRCCPAAARSTDAGRPGRGRDGLGPGRRRPARDARPRHRRDPRRRRGDGELGGAGRSAGSTRTTCPTRRLALRRAGASAGFLVSLEMRASARSPSWPTWCCRSRRRAEKSGTFVNWEGRLRPFEAARSTARHAARRPGARHPRRRDGRRPVHPDARGRGRRELAPARARPRRPAPPPGRRPRPRRCRPAVRRAGGARHLAPAARRSLARRRRAALAGTARPALAAGQPGHRPSASGR